MKTPTIQGGHHKHLRYLPFGLFSLSAVAIILVDLYIIKPGGTNDSFSNIMISSVSLRSQLNAFVVCLLLSTGTCFPLFADIITDGWHRILVNNVRSISKLFDLILQFIGLAAIFVSNVLLFWVVDESGSTKWLIFHLLSLVLVTTVLQYLTSVAGIITHINIPITSALCYATIIFNFITIHWRSEAVFETLMIVDLCLLGLTILFSIWGSYCWVSNNFNDTHRSLVTPDEYCGLGLSLILLFWFTLLTASEIVLIFARHDDYIPIDAPLVCLSFTFMVAINTCHKRKMILVGDSSEVGIFKFTN
jgi:hypothetical protein